MTRKQRLEHKHRSEAAKFAWQFRKAHDEWLHKKRSEAARRGWNKRRKRAWKRIQVPEFEEIELRIDYED